MDDEPLRGDTRLAVVLAAGGRRDFGGAGEIGRRHHDERVAAAKLQHGVLDDIASRRRHGPASRATAGQGCGDDPGVAQHRLHLRRADEQGLEDALGKARPAKQLLHEQGRLGHVGGVLEQADVASHQGRGCKAHRLPQREVPGHHGQHRAERLPTGVGPRRANGLRVHRFVQKHRLRVLGVVAAAGRALGDLGQGGLARLAHLGRHDGRDRLRLVVEDASRLAQPLRALGVRREPVLPEGACRLGQLVLDLGVGEGVEGLEHLAGGGVGGGDGDDGSHGASPGSVICSKAYHCLPCRTPVTERRVAAKGPRAGWAPRRSG